MTDEAKEPTGAEQQEKEKDSDTDQMQDGGNNTENQPGGSPEAKAAEAASKALETSKEAVGDAVLALKKLLQDPATGQANVVETLGDSRCFKAGIALCLCFVVCAWIGTIRTLGPMMELLKFARTDDPFASLGVADHVKVILASAVPVAATVICLMLIKKLMDAAGNVKQFTFSTGVAFFPFAIILLLSLVLGAVNAKITAYLVLFGATTTVLMLNATLTTVMKVSARAALLLVPVVMVIAVFISRMLYASVGS